MADPRDLKTTLERAIKAVRLRPAVGQGTAATAVRIRNGLTADIEDGGWKLVADEGRDLGGDGRGPDPGVFTRAALGSCLAIGYVMWAAMFDVVLDSVEVTVEADYDARGLFGIDDSMPAGWSAVRYTTKISSPATEQRIRELIEYADGHSSLLDGFQRAVPITGTINVTRKVGT